MGYDMHWRHEPAEVVEAHDEAFPRHGKVNGEAVERWWHLREQVGSYFRLNIWGMQQYRQYMEERGMIEWESSSPDWPSPEQFNVPAAEQEEWPDEDDPNASIQFKAYMAARALCLEHDHGGVIAGYKLCSNDGWIVTPAEITRALTALEDWEARQRDKHGQSWIDPLRNDPEDRDEDDGKSYWDKWIRYLYVSRAYGGVEVW